MLRVRIFKRLKSPGIDSEESIAPSWEFVYKYGLSIYFNLGTDQESTVYQSGFRPRLFRGSKLKNVQKKKLFYASITNVRLNKKLPAFRELHFYNSTSVFFSSVAAKKCSLGLVPSF
jgi:hypothetical protein